MTDTKSTLPPILRLIEVMAALRTPGTGCPWDLEQTFATIAPYTIEEAYEVADAIARDDLADLKDELGDLLLQVVYHARIAEEASAFAFDDVADAIVRKMIRRHPHVFGTPEQRAAGAAPDFWKRIKAEERAEKARDRLALAHAAERDGSGEQADPPDHVPPPSLLDDVPIGLPALTRAVKLQDKAAQVGFDWPSLGPVFEKLQEEIREFEEVALPADPRGAAAKLQDRARIEEEYGDLLFVMANIARHLQIHPEEALRGANRKFTRRFRHIEARLAGQGKTPKESTLEEMDRLWDEARAADKEQR